MDGIEETRYKQTVRVWVLVEESNIETGRRAPIWSYPGRCRTIETGQWAPIMSLASSLGVS